MARLASMELERGAAVSVSERVYSVGSIPDQHRSAEADDELRQEQLEDERELEPRGIGEFLRAHWISVSVAALVLIAGNGRSDIQLDPVDAAARAE